MPQKKQKAKTKSPKKAKSRRGLYAALALCAAVFVCVLIAAWHFFGPASSGPEVVIVIEPGTGVAVVARMLESKGLVKSAESFLLVAKAKGLAGKIRAGEFAVPMSLRPDEVLERLVHGPVVQHRLTIPEGYTARQIAALMAQNGIGDEARIRDLLRDKSFAASLGVPEQGFEGFLFPETYQYTRGTSARELLGRMTEQFFRVFDARMKSRMMEQGMSLLQTVTLASIVEKETGSAPERPHVASVFFNRLKTGMPLQSDPTVIYGMGDRYHGNITRADLRTPTPFNTYTRSGLPPHPICNPGKASIEAVLWPLKTGDLYFVSRKDGTHVFTPDYGEHIKNVQKFQK